MLLALKGLAKRFGSVAVLHGLDLDVMRNEFLTILGPSGSGKTTILRLIGGFEAPSAGAILFEGRDFAGVPANRRPFNTVFQDYALFPHMSVRENVSYGLRIRGRPKAEIDRRVEAVLATVGLDRLGRRLPAELSGGQRQRVALARAIVLEPRLILLDEPLAALDVELRGQMQRFLKDLQRRLGITFLFITHDQEEAMTLSDRIVVMREGRIEQVGPPTVLYYRPATPFVAGFFGENNLLPGRLHGSRDGVARCDTALGTILARAPGAPEAGAVTLAVRPEAITLTENGRAAENRVACRVEDVQFAGASLLLDLVSEAGGARLRARLTSPGGVGVPERGEAVVAAWSAADTAIVAAAAP